jgi:hypothetical protein
MSDTLSDWLAGQVIDLRGRKKVLLAAGVLSRTGDASVQLGNFSRYLRREYGFSKGDFLEATYRGRLSGSEWSPTPYQQADCEVPLAQSTAQIIRQLRWYDARLPIDVELHLVGYSLGGVVLFGAAASLLAEDPAHWRQRLGSLITIASPHFGTDLGIEGDLLGIFGLGPLLLPGGAVGRELCQLGSDPTHRPRVEQQAELLRRNGVQLLTMADEFDTVVTPADAVIASAGERARYVLQSSRSRLGGAYEGAVLGHGPLLDNPKAWRMMAEVIGPQEPRLRTATGAIPL